MPETIEQEAIAAATQEPPAHNIKECPCGKTPEGLYIEMVGATQVGAKLGAASGSCCGTWRIEFINNYATGDDTTRLAVQAWNDAPRA